MNLRNLHKHNKTGYVIISGEGQRKSKWISRVSDYLLPRKRQVATAPHMDPKQTLAKIYGRVYSALVNKQTGFLTIWLGLSN